MAKKDDNRETLIENERQRLLKLFEKLPKNRLELAKGLIENAAFMSVTLQDLIKAINDEGVKEKYKNGKNQYGYKDSVESKAYDKMIKNYNSIIKQLNDMMPKDIGTPQDDGFESFGDD